MKRCKKCNTIKPLNNFNNDKKAKDGYRNDCKECKKQYKSKWYNFNKQDQIIKTVKWHIDHIKPLAYFDLTDKVQFLVACNYINLQPLWAKDNLSKGASLTGNTWYNNDIKICNNRTSNDQ